VPGTTLGLLLCQGRRADGEEAPADIAIASGRP
jgi:hypothetical protein